MVTTQTFFGMFTPIPGEMIKFDEHIFQTGWLNHQLVLCCFVLFLKIKCFGFGCIILCTYDKNVVFFAYAYILHTTCKKAVSTVIESLHPLPYLDSFWLKAPTPQKRLVDCKISNLETSPAVAT